MILLLLFAFVAGAGTAVTPCVLPILPALLSASSTGGRRRPLGIVAGLVITHTIAIVALASLIEGVGLADGFVRTFAVVVLLIFGLSLVVPALGDRLERPLSRLARFGPKTRGEGFWSGLGVGGALGFVYAPCAGPVVAAVISVGATQGTSAGLVATALAYGLGSALVLLLIALGGRRVTAGIRAAGRGPVLQRAMGVVMIATAIAVFADFDVRFQTALANDFPDLITNPTGGLERSDAAERRLADLRGEARFDSDRPPARPAVPPLEPTPAAAATPELPVLGTAPDFTGTQRWFNTSGGRKLSLPALKGRVVLVDFWTYTCINCIRTLPYIKAWDRKYRGKGLTIVGVHTPEFAFEKDAGNVRDAIDQNKLRYPVAQDNDYATWTAYGNNVWPAKYLIDAQGRVRYTHFGEGEYEETEAAIRALLAEASRAKLGDTVEATAETVSPGVETPETYLGHMRAERFLPEPLTPGRRRYPGFRDELPPSHFALKGAWNVDGESATAVRGASLDAQFGAAKVFLVLSSRGGKARRVRVLLDGKPLPDRLAGRDVKGGVATVRGQDLYRLVELPAVEQHRLTLKFAPGVSGFAFTFG